MANDNIIGFTGGFMLVTGMSTTTMAITQAAIVGLVGGFFGIIGKEIYYWVKRKLNKQK